MSALSITLPNSIREKVEELAREEGVTIDAFVASVLAQRVAVANVDSYVRIRAKRGSAERMMELLERAPNVEPESFDRLSPPTE